MKKIKQLLIVSFIALISSAICFTGCDSQLAQLEESNTEKTGEKDSENEQPAAKTGTITGKALYSNADDNSGIIISLEKTEESISASVASAICSVGRSRSLEESRSQFAISRSISGTTTTASDGSYKFENVEAGTYTIYASSNTSSEKAVFTNVSVSADATATVSDLKLTATGNISGVITLDGTTTGNEAFLVFVAGTSYMAMTDSTGKFTISGVPAGKDYQLIVTKGKLTKTISSSVTVTASGNTTIPDINFKDEDVNGKEEKNPFELKRYFREPELCLTYTTTDDRKTKTLSDNIGNPTHLGKGCYKISINLLYCISAFSKEIYHSESSEEYTISELLKYDPNFKITSSSDLVCISEDYSEITVSAATDSEQLLSVIKLNLHFNPEILILSEGYTSEYYLHLGTYEGFNFVDYADYLNSEYSIKVKNETPYKVVCFLGEPSDETLIGGAVDGGKTTGLKKDTKLFKDSSFDFVLYVYTEEAYLNGMNDYKTLAQNPLCRLYAFYNADAQAKANLIYTISDKLGGEYYFQLNNNTKYNCEIRKDGLYGEPFCYAGAQTLKTIIYAQEGDYDFYPVFRKYDKNSGAILTNYPKTKKGNPIYVAIGLGKGEEAATINCSGFLSSDFTLSPAATYLKINNISASSVHLYKGATAMPYVTDAGISEINPGKQATFTIPLDRLNEVTFEESTVIGGWCVGPEFTKVSVPTATLLGGEHYTLVVSGSSYDDISCAFNGGNDNPEHIKMSID